MYRQQGIKKGRIHLAMTPSRFRGSGKLKFTVATFLCGACVYTPVQLAIHINLSAPPSPPVASTMSSRPPSPLKKSIKKFLSPTKSKPAPALSLQGASEHNNWTYAGSSSSTYSSDGDGGGTTGWNVVEQPGFTSDKENVRATKDIVNNVMGRTKLSKRNTKSTGVLSSKPHNPELDREFEELMVTLRLKFLLMQNSRSIPTELRCKLRSVDVTVKQQMLKNHSSLSHSPTKSPSKLFHYSSNVNLHSSPKKKKHNSSVPSSPVKAHPAAIFKEGKVWDVEMQTVGDVRAYFCGIKTGDIDVGMVKKLWQLLRNETMMYVLTGWADVGGLMSF